MPFIYCIAVVVNTDFFAGITLSSTLQIIIHQICSEVKTLWIIHRIPKTALKLNKFVSLLINACSLKKNQSSIKKTHQVLFRLIRA